MDGWNNTCCKLLIVTEKFTPLHKALISTIIPNSKFLFLFMATVKMASLSTDALSLHFPDAQKHKKAGYSRLQEEKQLEEMWQA